MFYSTIYYLSLTDWINKIMSGKILINSLGRVIYKDGKPIVITIPNQFTALPIVDDVANWDILNDGLNKNVNPLNSFTLNLTNLYNGIKATLIINSITPITITLNLPPLEEFYVIGNLENLNGLHVIEIINNGETTIIKTT